MPRMTLRTLVFWLHLTAGVVAGAVISVMSVTGVILAFERQIVAFAERQGRTAEPPAPGAPRLGPDALVAKAREAAPEGTPSALILSADMICIANACAKRACKSGFWRKRCVNHQTF